MKLKLVGSAVAGLVLLAAAGCQTGPRAAAWEYKTVEAPRGSQDATIARLAEEGWKVIAFSATEGQANVVSYHYVLQRPRR
jgi:hypothetical protein